MFFRTWHFWLALKYVFSPKRERFTSIIALIAIIGVTLSVASLTIVNSIMTGFKEALFKRIVGFNPHIIITFLEKTEEPLVTKIIKETIPKNEIENIHPFFQISGILVSSIDQQPVFIKGVNLLNLPKIFFFEKFRISQELLNASKTKFPLVIGDSLAKELKITIGSEVKFFSMEGMNTLFGFFPKLMRFKVVGIYKTGIYDYDQTICFTSYDKFLTKETPPFYGVEIKLKDPFKSYFYTIRISQKLKGFANVIDWQEWNRNLFVALKLEKIGLFLILSLMIIVSLFTILSAMIMLVNEKKTDIAIIRAMGATSYDVLKIFFYCGLMLSLIGISLGLILGLSICFILAKIPFIKLPSDVYPVEYLPIKVKFLDVCLIICFSLIASIISCFYPAKKASKFSPAEILRRD